MIAAVLEPSTVFLIMFAIGAVLHAVNKARTKQEDRELLASLDPALRLDRQCAHILLESWH